MKIVLNDQRKLDEIIFANRNKNYGAYAIRASYNNTLLKSLIIVSASLFLFIGISYILTRVKEEKKIEYFGDNSAFAHPIDLTPIDKPKPQPKPSSAKPPKSNSIATVVSDTANAQKPDVLNVNNNPNGKPDGDTNYVAGTIGNGTGTLTITTPTVDDKPLPPVVDPDEGPEFEGGLPALAEFIKNNMIYPSIARDIGKEGTVYVSFVVNEKGYVQDANVLRGIGAGCDEEAARVVSKIPKFKKAGRKGGRFVQVIYNIPIKFKLR